MRGYLFFALLFLLSAASAYPSGSVQLYPFEYKDFLNESLPEFDMTLMMNCHAGTISAYVRSDGQPVSGASSNLKYVQYENPLLSTGITDETGLVTHKLNGNISFMTGIFVLTVEKNGYRRREAHFLITPCFSDEETPSGGNGTPPVTVQNTSLFNSSTPAPSNPATNSTQNNSGNATLNASSLNQSGNQSGAGKPKPAGEVLCPFSQALIMFALCAAYLSNRR